MRQYQIKPTDEQLYQMAINRYLIESGQAVAVDAFTGEPIK